MKEKILIVDDDKTMRWTIAQALQSWRFVVAEAGTISDGLNAFDAEQPTVVLLDINLPDGSGLDALREMKRRQPQAVVIIVSSSVLVDDAVSALRGGAYDFVSKPPHLDELQ